MASRRSTPRVGRVVLLAGGVGGAKMAHGLQAQVGDRLAAKPGRKAYGALSILAQLHCRIERLLELPPGAFSPPPKVRSSVVRLTFTPPAVRVADDLLFDQIVKALFSQRRKTLLNALKPVADSFGRSAPQVLEQAQLDPSRRPETLDIQEMARLSRAVL